MIITGFVVVVGVTLSAAAAGAVSSPAARDD